MNKFKFKKKDLVQLIKEEIENMNEQDNVDQLDEIFGKGLFGGKTKKQQDTLPELPTDGKFIDSANTSENLYNLFVDQAISPQEFQKIYKTVSSHRSSQKNHMGLVGKIVLYLETEAERLENLDQEGANTLSKLSVLLSRIVVAGQNSFNKIKQKELSGFEKSPQATQSDINRMKRNTRTPFSTRGGAGMIPGSVAESKQQQIENLIVQQISKTLENLV